MWSSLPFLSLILTAGVFLLGCVPASSSDSRQGLQQSDASTNFSLKLYGHLKCKYPELVFSGYSIHTALTMASMGARGNTSTEMMSTLELNPSKAGFMKRCQTYAGKIIDFSNTTLDLANAVYVRNGLKTKNGFKKCLENHFNAKFEVLPASDPESVINSWVANKTGNKIQDLLSDGTVTANTMMILINAIYFKGTWKYQFQTSDTKNEAFYLNGSASNATVEMMHLSATLKYRNSYDLHADIVELPYKGDRFSMYFFVPHELTGLAAMERTLTLKTLSDSLDKLFPRKVELSVPKFKSETEFSVKKTLQDMGMTEPFSDRANFRRISNTPLKISDVIHKAIIEVNEEGTEAAGATAVMMMARSLSISTAVSADHPFMYVIRDKNSKAVIFMGKYIGPK